MMWNYIRRKLRLYEISEDISFLDQRTRRIEEAMYKLASEVRVQNAALGRIIAKLDPTFGKSESDPDRKADSDRLAEEAIKRLEAEDWAQRHTEGKA